MVAQSPIETLAETGDAGLGAGSDVEAAGWIAAALEATLAARAPALDSSTALIAQLAGRVGRALGLDARARALLEISVRVRDIGMLGLPESVVLSTESFTPRDWELVHRHPVLGAELLESLTPVAEAAQVVLCHHERWDGEGYPEGRRGDAIPLLGRVIAVCDAFVAMASDRPYRRRIGTPAALERVRLERGAHFDPRITDTFLVIVAGTSRAPDAAEGAEGDEGAKTVDRAPPRGRPVSPGRRDLANAIAEFDVVPAFAPACERALVATESQSTNGREMVAAIESDAGLTVAVLRKAQAVAGSRKAVNVAEAVMALSPGDIREAITALPRAQFPWRTTPLEVVMQRFHLHAQAVSRAADRIAREVGLGQSDDLLVAALLHDIGKLVLSRFGPYSGAIDVGSKSPEVRIREERRVLGVDHASLGALLLRRWLLPDQLASTVAAHHTSDSGIEVATYVRLADMLAHHADGDTVENANMLRLANACGLPAKVLRDVLFDLPHSAGSQRHRAEPSPLSTRETEVLRLLAQAKHYKVIAAELGIAASTVRTHLHNTYYKLGVDDRAQAVLRATEMGWI